MLWRAWLRSEVLAVTEHLIVIRGTTVKVTPLHPESLERLDTMNRRQKLESMLEAEPDDPFLQYALAMQCASEGDDAEGVQRLDGLLARKPEYVAAYLQLALLLEKRSEGERCLSVLRQGIEAAHRSGDSHAEGEMRGFLEQFGG